MGDWTTMNRATWRRVSQIQMAPAERTADPVAAVATLPEWRIHVHKEECDVHLSAVLMCVPVALHCCVAVAAVGAGQEPPLFSLFFSVFSLSGCRALAVLDLWRCESAQTTTDETKGRRHDGSQQKRGITRQHKDLHHI